MPETVKHKTANPPKEPPKEGESKLINPRGRGRTRLTNVKDRNEEFRNPEDHGR